MIRRYALVVAGGKGIRMGSNTPKQFLLLKSMPILMRTLLQFHLCDTSINILLVLPAGEMSHWQELCLQYNFAVPHQLVVGGGSRTKSVSNGLASIGNDEGLVAIHDGVRPLVDTQLIERCYNVAADKGNAIASVLLKDSIRWKEGKNNKAMDRSLFRLIQTPQTFWIGQIKEAYSTLSDGTMTDDASVLEAAGHDIHLVEGSYRNIKITTKEDILIAEALYQ